MEYKERSLTSSAYVANTSTEPLELNFEFDSKNTSVPEPSDIYDLCVLEMNDKSVSITTDVSLIFDQQRISQMTPDNIRNYISKFVPRKSPYVEKMDDEMLMNSVKSRNIQSMSEIKAWSEFITDEFIATKQDIDERIQESLAANEQPVEKTD